MRQFSTLTLALLSSLIFHIAWSAVPEEKNLWALFQQVPFKEKLNRDFGMYFYYPEFTDELIALEGKEVELKGFHIPLDLERNDIIILSKYPMAECFFCGAAGPESVAVVYTKEKPRRLKLDEIVTVRGILELNADNVEEMTFIIKEAELD
ncbi:hypothetical protein [Algoriphagus sediminis]|uniref:DUF3299 domain-containing protein n=1 Tax=Algoriphagus sediminis TaxID=3057113 RepID=A0ABT7Y9L3_9BACT|nr:hypothetical protein [Algoriphagus sediminis]MDN3203203.1 hypothetical protein [Algoriphagus sediminis]